MTPNHPFDKLDFRIIHELNEDARRSASEIARAVSANERTVRKRIDRLVQSGAVRLTAVVNPPAFGYDTAVDIFLEVDPHQEKEIIDRLSEMQEVSYIAFGQGTNELSIEARFKDNGEMREFLGQTLPSIASLKVTRYTLVPRIFRNIDEWMPKEEDFLRETEE
jgi:DNA-binding Lrp family transcriptional regulator